MWRGCGWLAGWLAGWRVVNQPVRSLTLRLPALPLVVAGWLAGCDWLVGRRQTGVRVLSVSGSRSSPPGVAVCCGLTSAAREEGEA